MTLPAESRLHIERVRPMHFAEAVFWFEATFVSDQKEQELMPVAMDLHYGRQVRHLELLLDSSRLAGKPAVPLPESRRLSVARSPCCCNSQVGSNWTAHNKPPHSVVSMTAAANLLRLKPDCRATRTKKK